MDGFPTAGSFTHVVGEHLTRSGYNICQVARLAGLPRRTVANWLDGVVTKPRNWLDVVKLARALRLSLNEANKPCWGEVFGQCETPPGCGPASSPRRLFAMP